VRFTRLENINKKGSVAMMNGSSKNLSIRFKTAIIAKIKKAKWLNFHKPKILV
jgi:hypothetical protein